MPPKSKKPTKSTKAKSSKKKASSSAQLTQAEAVEAREAFDLMDVSRKGAISANDVSAALRTLGLAPTADNTASFDEWVSFDAFLSIVADVVCYARLFFCTVNSLTDAQRTQTAMDSEMAVAFQLFDTEKKGFISIEDLKRVVRELVSELRRKQVGRPKLYF